LLRYNTPTFTAFIIKKKMKKSILLMFSIVAIGWQANAQEISKNAIGVRLSESNGMGAEVNFQRALWGSNRLELGLAYHSDSNWDTGKFTAIYQWLWNIDGGFNWYAGPGAGLGIEKYEHPKNSYYENADAFVFATGDVGIEYSFDFPLLVSFDFRPQFNIGSRDDVTFDIGLSARYKF
jgi:hypothetical protein